MQIFYACIKLNNLFVSLLMINLHLNHKFRHTISQKVHWFHEQPSVTGRISDSASLGGRNTGST